MSDRPAGVPVSSGRSLYANLLQPNSSSAAAGATISRAPVAYTQDSHLEADSLAKKPVINAAALRFQPTKRPQIATKSKPRTAPSKSVISNVSVEPVAETGTATSIPAATRSHVKSSLADWTNDDQDVNGFYADTPKHQRGGRKRRKKNKDEYIAAQDWDDIYDPSRPNNYEEYKHSEEKIREVREWKDRLYAHRMVSKPDNDLDSSDEERPRPIRNSAFAPPSSISFAPPPLKTAESCAQPPPPPPPPPAIRDTEDEMTRRASTPPVQHSAAAIPPPPPPEPANATTTISRAPVRYALPEAPPELPATEEELATALTDPSSQQSAPVEDAPRSSRPGQAGFAERLMNKYGWTKGSGLGADGSGIINPLHVQMSKRKKKPDSEGGGFADPKGVGKIVGGRKKDPDGDVGKFGKMSETVRLVGMVDGIADAEGDEGGLMLEIAGECGDKYGRVERVFIDRSAEGQDGGRSRVFVRFTSQLSALRAVNALEGRVFGGNVIEARFYDSERFEEGKYD